MSFAGLQVYQGVTPDTATLRWPAVSLATAYAVLGATGTVSGQSASVTGMVADTAYTLQIQATLSAGGPVVSNSVAYQYGSKEQMTVTSMTRPFPFPSTGQYLGY